MTTPPNGIEEGDAHAEAFEAWCRRREVEGRRITLVDLYDMVAEARGVHADDLPASERKALWELAAPVIASGIEFAPGSERPQESIELVPYSAEWPERFELWRARLASGLGAAALRIEHVGSTSVPTLDAKPIVDIQISVANLADEDRYVPGCTAAGVVLRFRDDDHAYFRPPAEAPRAVHVHVCETGSRWEREHLLFRDYLREHPDARERYAATKRDAAARWRDDRMGYTEAKTAVILDTLAAAEAWARLADWNASGVALHPMADSPDDAGRTQGTDTGSANPGSTPKASETTPSKTLKSDGPQEVVDAARQESETPADETDEG